MIRATRDAERPRVALLLTVVAVLVAVSLAAGGVMAGKASVDDEGPTPHRRRHLLRLVHACRCQHPAKLLRHVLPRYDQEAANPRLSRKLCAQV